MRLPCFHLPVLKSRLSLKSRLHPKPMLVPIGEKNPAVMNLAVKDTSKDLPVNSEVKYSGEIEMTYSPKPEITITRTIVVIFIRRSKTVMYQKAGYSVPRAQSQRQAVRGDYKPEPDLKVIPLILPKLDENKT